MYRQIIFLLSLMLSELSTSAQSSEGREMIPKGSIFVAGSVGAGFSRVVGQSDYNSFSIGPVFGNYFRDNWYWGISFRYERNKSKAPTHYDISENLNLSLSVAKDYKIAKNIFFELQPEISVAQYIGKSNDGSQTLKVSSESYSAGVNAGLLFFLSERIALRNWLGGIGYNTSFNDDHNSGLSLSTGALNFTFLYFLK